MQANQQNSTEIKIPTFDISDSQVFLFFRDDTISDRFARAINAPFGGANSESDITTGKTAGVVYQFNKVYQMNELTNLQFMICMNGLWEISVDNIRFTEVTD